MEFRILGPLEVLDQGRVLEIGGHKQRALLAVLLLRANEVVSLDTLIDELWGEKPPPTAAKTLQAHVSRLRKTFADTSGSGRLETRGQGYLLRVHHGQLDAEVFRSGLEHARSALADGDPETAAKGLREVLELWRGPALADFAYEPFAQTEIARLEELRIAALEERIEADLALGRHAALVPELETLVAAHPLRERLLGQLMLALYRSDRQAEALQAYQRGRQALAEELGLEPSQSLQRIERQILDQDAALSAPARKNRPQFVPASAWRHPRRILLAGTLVLAAAVAAAAFQLTRGGEEIATAGAVVLDAKTSKVLDAVPLGTAPSSVAIGTEDVWVLDADDRTVSQIDAGSRHVLRTFNTGSIPTDIAAGPGAIWVANGSETSGSQLPASISRLDADSGEIDTTITLRRSPGGHLFGVLAGLSRQQIALTHDAVWVINPDQSVSRIDSGTNRLETTIRDVSAENIAAGEGQVWVTEGSSIAQIDPSSNRVLRRIELEVDTLSGLAVGAGAVWVTDPFGGKVWRVSVEPTLVKRSIPLETWVAAITFSDGLVWAANEIADEVYRIDPRTNGATVVRGISAPRSIDAADSSVWVTAAAPPSSDAALPSPVCGPLFYSGAGSPDVLLVSDLPLKGDARGAVLPMVQGIRHVLEQREFDAGGYSVGYQSCDSSTAQAGTSDFFRCGLNAKAFARNLRVVAEFGSYFSPCSYLQIPIANRAPEGPLAMISPSNTYQDLTEDEDLYPTGARNFFRLAAADHLQAVAHAELAKRLGVRRLVTLAPRGDSYMARFVADVRTAARRLRVGIEGSAEYDSEAMDFTAFARRVGRAHPDAVVVAGILVPATGALLRDLRAVLGPGVALVAPDGFRLPGDLQKLAGAGAQGLYVSNYGIPNSRLPLRGKRFLESFTSGRGAGPGPDLSAAYGAQAAEILLDAIARSDGTRASVTRELRRTRIEDGILGDIRFDRNGDLVQAPVTFFRVRGKRFVVDRVVTARSTLLAERPDG